MKSIFLAVVILFSFTALAQDRSPSAIIHKGVISQLKKSYGNRRGTVKLKLKIVFKKAPVEDKKEYLKTVIHKAANKISQYANVDFKFVSEKSKRADIKIEVISNLPHQYHDGVIPRGGHGYWDPNQRKIMVNLPIDSNPANIYEVIIHEMGHMLGMEHEHHHPSREFTFDREFTNKQCHKASVDTEKCLLNAEYNKYRLVDPKNSLISDYDIKSVMHYSSTQLRINENREFSTSYDLSLLDRVYLAKAYPGRASEDQIRRDHSQELNKLSLKAIKNSSCQPYLETRFPSESYYAYVLPNGQRHQFFSSSVDQAYFNILLDERCAKI